MLRFERMKSILTIWRIWPDLLVWFGPAASRFAGFSLRSASFHIVWQREEGMVSFYRPQTRWFLGSKIEAGFCRILCAVSYHCAGRARERYGIHIHKFKLAPYKTIYLSITSLTTPLSKNRLRQVVDIGEANPTLSKNFKSDYF